MCQSKGVGKKWVFREGKVEIPALPDQRQVPLHGHYCNEKR
jgi:hypothetical protein